MTKLEEHSHDTSIEQIAAQAESGRRIVVGVASALLLSALTRGVLFETGVIRLLLTGLFLYQLATGSRWARWLTIATLAALGPLLIVFGSSVLDQALGIGYVSAAYLLLAPASVREYFREPTQSAWREKLRADASAAGPSANAGTLPASTIRTQRRRRRRALGANR